MNELEREIIHIVKTPEAQDFKDEHEINNQVYMFTKTTDFEQGEWIYTDVSGEEMLEAQKKMENDETGIIFMSASNLKEFMAEYYS